jgi:hypothetical protein
MLLTLTPSEVSTLQSSLDHWEVGEYVCTGFVILGVFGEYVAEFTQWLGGGEEKSNKILEKYSTLVLWSR